MGNPEITDGFPLWPHKGALNAFFPLRLEQFFENRVSGDFRRLNQCQKLGKIFTCPTYKLSFSFTLILDACRSFIPNKTRATRTPAFWGYSAPLDYPYYCFISDHKLKQERVKVTNLKNLPKTSHFGILKTTFHATHPLKMLDKMCKYEIDPAGIVEGTQQTRFCPQKDRRTDGRTDGQTRWNQCIPRSTSLKRGI